MLTHPSNPSKRERTTSERGAGRRRGAEHERGAVAACESAAGDRSTPTASLAPAKPITLEERFHKLSHLTSEIVGHSRAFFCAALVIALWGVSGPFFHFSDTWQLVINTGTTIVTFLMVFLIQNTQNRDAHAIHLKLDELIRANRHARNGLLALELRSDDELRQLQVEFEQLRDRVQDVRKRRTQPGQRPT